MVVELGAIILCKEASDSVYNNGKELVLFFFKFKKIIFV